MGQFYVNFCVTDFPAEDIEPWLERLEIPSYTAEFGARWTCIVAEPLDQQDQDVIDAFGEALTKDSARIAICVLNHDDDFLSVDIFKGGARSGSYNSCPDYFSPDPDAEDQPPKLRSPESFAEVCDGVGKDQIVKELMGADDYTFADELHFKLVRLLDLPEETVGAGFHYVSKGDVAGDWKPIGIEK